MSSADSSADEGASDRTKDERLTSPDGRLAQATLRSLLIMLERKGLLTAEELIEVVTAGVQATKPDDTPATVLGGPASGRA